MLSLDPYCAETSTEWALISEPNVISAIMTMCFVIKGLWLSWWLLMWKEATAILPE